MGPVGAVELIGQAVMVFFRTFFLLLSGGTSKRWLVRLTGPSLSSGTITVITKVAAQHVEQLEPMMVLLGE